MQTILLTGGTGLIGKHLSNLLLQHGYAVYILTRSKSIRVSEQLCYIHWNVMEANIDERLFPEGDFKIIHLAGCSVVANAWNKPYQKEIIDSRVNTIDLLLQKFGPRIKQIVTASGTNGYFSEDTDQEFIESDPILSDHFLGEVVKKWEDASFENKFNIPTAALRTSTVLAKDGGAFSLLNKLAKFGVLCPLGSGNYYFPWIHIEDLCNLYLFAIQNELTGTFNAVADEQVKQKEILRQIAKKNNRWLLPPLAPSFLIKMLLDQRSKLFLTGAQINNDKIKAAGFNFSYPKINIALNQLIN